MLLSLFVFVADVDACWCCRCCVLVFVVACCLLLFGCCCCGAYVFDVCVCVDVVLVVGVCCNCCWLCFVVVCVCC